MSIETENGSTSGYQQPSPHEISSIGQDFNDMLGNSAPGRVADLIETGDYAFDPSAYGVAAPAAPAPRFEGSS